MVKKNEAYIPSSIFIIALFLSSHFNSMIVDGLDEEEPFNLDIMVVSEEPNQIVQCQLILSFSREMLGTISA